MLDQFCCNSWKLTVVDKARLHGVERQIIRMCGVRLVDRVPTDILCNRLGVVVKIEDMIIQNHLWWYGHIMHGDINSQVY